jgi:uncharacterized protein (DUF1330 family)
LKLTDRAAYDRYHSEFLGLFAQFKGTLVAADEHPEVVEAETDVDKVVLMSFPDRADYRRISVNRHAGADTAVLLIGGLPASISKSHGVQQHP